MPKSKNNDPDYIQQQDKIVHELSKILGKPDDHVFHSMLPLYMGGPPDVFQFSHAPEGGVFYVTAGLTADGSGQKPNSVGNYELAIALREPADWAPDLISKLGLYSMQAVLEPTATMDVTGAFPKGSTLNSLVFLEHTAEETRFKIGGRACSILLAQGLV